MKSGTFKVKICGITNFDDALMSIEAGADMLGFNFYPPSPRYISPAACRKIIGALERQSRSAIYVGVFVNTPVEDIATILDDSGLDLAQLSGDEPVESLLTMGERAFKGLRPRSLNEVLESAPRYANERTAPALLIDAHQVGAYGGTGQLANWQVARAVAERYPLLLAGGLNAGNVARALDEVHPWGVDVASGVEAVPGKKDRQKICEFLREVKNFDQELVSC
jgi:phosphoribosylanthranilate isomerase